MSSHLDSVNLLKTTLYIKYFSHGILCHTIPNSIEITVQWFRGNIRTTVKESKYLQLESSWWIQLWKEMRRGFTVQFCNTRIWLHFVFTFCLSEMLEDEIESLQIITSATQAVKPVYHPVYQSVCQLFIVLTGTAII